MAVASDGRGPGFEQFVQEIREALDSRFVDEEALAGAADAVAHHLATSGGWFINNDKVHVVGEVNWLDWHDFGQSWTVYTDGRS